MQKSIKALWNESIGSLLKGFTAIVTKSPVANVTLVLSGFLGFGVSYTLFDYRRAESSKVPFPLHILLGLGYAAFIFIIVNFDLLSRNLSIEQIITRVPITMLTSFSVAFIVIVTVVLLRK